jgi:hypothetical protein
MNEVYVARLALWIDAYLPPPADAWKRARKQASLNAASEDLC